MILLLLLAIGVGRSAPAQLEFDEPDSILPGLLPTSLATGDFNEDGWDDLAILEAGSSSLLLGNASSSFDVVPLGLPVDAERLVSGDFDEDGHLDLAVARPGQIQIFHGDGTGGFTAGNGCPEPASPLVTADVNGDGHLDLLAFNIFATFHVCLGLGTGEFDPSYPVGTHAVISRALVGDFNGDSLPDVFAVSPSGHLRIFPSLGGGNFADSILLAPESGGSRTFIVADFTEDGFDDLLTRRFGLNLFVADGEGGFEDPIPVESGRQVDLSDPVVADWNEDGHLDVAFTGIDTVSFFFGDGSGGFSRTHRGTRNPVTDLVPADVDHDGNEDALLLDFPNGLSILRGDGAGSFDSLEPTETVSNLQYFALADLNGDDNLDLVTDHEERLRVRLGDGRGGLSAPYAPFGNGTTDGLYALVDVNGDAVPDGVLLGQGGASSIAVYPGLGNGGFLPPVVTAIPDLEAPPIDPEVDLVTGDLDGDDIPDVVVKLTSHRIAVLRGDGSGGFLPPLIVSNGMSFHPVPSGIGDLNGDGHLDVVVSRRVSSPPGRPDRTTILLGDGTGNLNTFLHLPVGGAILVTEVDGDGHLDVLVGSPDGGVDVLRGIGDGTFTTPTLLAADLDASDRLDASDLDGDGVLDLIGHGRYTHQISLRGDSGAFLPVREIESGYFSIGSTVGDLDGDGLNDLITGGGNLWVFLNRTRFYGCRRGNVNGAAGPVTDVLLVNGSAGLFRSRTIFASPDDPVQLSIDASPAGGTRFVVYAWARPGTADTIRDAGFGLGFSCLPMPISGSMTGPRPQAIWKTIPGFENLLGEATHPASPAPTTLASIAQLGILGEFTFQGILLDPASPQGQAAITNAVRIVSVDRE